ncbi:MAG: monofunctional biosynthetic peptidoglycan transglycosylase [Bacteroidales bacterium]|nr:monofunctional biosynthetic peptidoglycan transglycosylase [Bacteroidales bacterium]MDD3273822.1 monofunctional biosynthetic peptidoglycan transglycosylase [Bacteroidales bacterium]MDD4057808.1 monofunctional biosynthetic peptidoglycan transglycosylase [Bacteroidales bacterium]
MKRKSFNKVLKFIFIYTPLSFILLSIFWILILKWVPVYLTPLMVTRSVQYMDNKEFKTVKRWRSIEKISDNLAMAVMASEDTRFLDHSGFDWTEIDNAVEDSKRGKRLRGASTISQQTAKNVFLFPSRSWVRKGLEAYFTIGIELIWGKKRIMEVYLNIAEMGMGIYGAEAAAQELFGKSADKLSTRESALIAAALPNPLKRRADKPSAYHNSRASAIQRMMRLIPKPEWLNEDKPKKKKVVK